MRRPQRPSYLVMPDESAKDIFSATTFIDD